MIKTWNDWLTSRAQRREQRFVVSSCVPTGYDTPDYGINTQKTNYPAEHYILKYPISTYVTTWIVATHNCSVAYCTLPIPWSEILTGTQYLSILQDNLNFLFAVIRYINILIYVAKQLNLLLFRLFDFFINKRKRKVAWTVLIFMEFI